MNNMEELKSRYLSLYGNEGCTQNTLLSIESALGLELPHDFKSIAEFYSGGSLGGISHHEIAAAGAATNVVDETLRIRNAVGLRKGLVVLAEPPVSIIVLDVFNTPAVIWCDAVEVENLNSMRFHNAPDLWDRYSDFFAYLLDRESEE
ncbi:MULTISPECIES: SMI1/KNR4 family protein [Pseudomonas]|uniref:SMI1/KNR4 family protein n=1 Tax=Pseudomonas quercus TaxID=2722792 RepID=A0ABX0YEB3_9PSED|nr:MULTISPECIES: SMI1/KNR4 family protein [Pseudomonas]MBF7142724.1 SMI1/KNR4 family protein [Pseudomonas sp. LY10J]NJP01262.1 SMI1/KNR4 family protein [Pseudomonas quercus]